MRASLVTKPRGQLPYQKVLYQLFPLRVFLNVEDSLVTKDTKRQLPAWNGQKPVRREI